MIDRLRQFAQLKSKFRYRDHMDFVRSLLLKSLNCKLFHIKIRRCPQNSTRSREQQGHLGFLRRYGVGRRRKKGGRDQSLKIIHKINAGLLQKEEQCPPWNCRVPNSRRLPGPLQRPCLPRFFNHVNSKVGSRTTTRKAFVGTFCLRWKRRPSIMRQY